MYNILVYCYDNIYIYIYICIPGAALFLMLRAIHEHDPELGGLISHSATCIGCLCAHRTPVGAP